MEEKNYLEESEKKIKEEEEKKTWKDRLQKDVFSVKGVTVEKIKKCPDNIITFLEYHPKYAGKIMYNDYLQMKEFDGKEFTDFQQSTINNDVFRYLGFSNKGWVEDCLNEIFLSHKYNPVVDYLNSLHWDGKKRIDTLFIDMFDAEDSKLNRKMTRKWMIAAVKRTLIPGCKFDNMIVLQGGQGIGKSTFCEKISKGFYNSISLNEIDNKDIIDKLNKTWVGIIDEMNNFNRRDMNDIKDFLSKSKEGARLAYEKNHREFKRHCVFIGTTNEDTFLRDITGTVERRFWCIKCNKTKMDSKISDTMTEEYVDQLWAEAYQYYKDDPEQYLDMDSDMMDDFAKVQEQFKTYNDDDIVDYLSDILDKQYRIDKDGEVTDISQIDDYSTGEKNYINKIKGYVIRELLNRKFHDSRSLKYLGQSLDGWECKDTWFKELKKSDKALVRVVRKNNEPKKAYNPMDEFTVGLNI